MTRGIKVTARQRSLGWTLVVFVCLGLWITGCAGGSKPSESCLVLVASPNLNQVDGEPHVVMVSLYPLQNIAAFNAADPIDLLKSDAKPPGFTGDRWEETVYPGEVKKIEVKLPRDTAFVGVLADFYNGPSRTVVEAKCPTIGSGARINLTTNDLQAE